MKVTRTYTQDFEKRYCKRFVQTLFYQLSRVSGNVTMLCGPALDAHIHDAKLIVHNNKRTFHHSKIRIYETDKTTYLKNIEDLKNIETKHNVLIIHDNITSAKAERFMDFDACKDFTSIEQEVSILYNKMKLRSKTKFKNIIVTCSFRTTGITTTIERLCSLFNITNNFKETFIRVGQNGVLNEQVISNDSVARYTVYRDKHAMLTFSYEWK